jgi:NTP pyrophosphatase (non-canonical NTP hydrolase)
VYSERVHEKTQHDWWIPLAIFGGSKMTLNEYQLLAQRTMNLALSHEETSRHALHGMCAEVGEIHGLYQKFYQGHEMDAEHVMKEVGDLLWMIAEFCTVNGWKLGDVAQMNIDKLKARYPGGFTAEKSLNRVEGDV